MRRSNLSIPGIAAAVVLAACSDTTPGERRADMEREPAGVDVARAPAPDNTGINERDRAGDTVTPMDQSNAEGDLAATREIRQAITGEDSLSVDAQNVKVITNAGVVVLRGPVASEQERMTVVAIARRAAGVVRVDDQLEVAPD